MIEIKNFDKAASKFYKKHHINVLPLLSYDIGGAYFQKICHFGNDMKSLEELSIENNWDYQHDFNKALIEKEHIIVVTDANLNIVNASHNIYEMNGYTPEEIVGKTPKMFQGPATNSKTTRYISEAVRKQKAFEATVLNYRKDGSTYKCWIKAEPIFDKRGKVVNFIAFERAVA